MRAFRRFPIEDGSQVGEARRAAQTLAADLGHDEQCAGRVALAVTELGTNLQRHVGPGREAALLVGVEGGHAGGRGGCVDDPPALQVLSLDRGAGMDVERCLRDGYSSAGSAGTGLGAIQRMSDGFHVFSAPGLGTVISVRFCARAAGGASSASAAARRDAPAAFEVAGLTIAAPGEIVSGDAWTLRRAGSLWTLGLADGLGHGREAAAAADRFCDLLRDAPETALSSPASLLDRLHEPLRSTRGCAAAVVTLTEGETALRFGGAGNIAGRLISGVADRSLMSQHGTLGMQVRRLQDVAYDWPPHAVLVLHSDGIVSRWSLGDVPGLLQADASLIAGWILRDHVRGRDDATVVVVRRAQDLAG